MFAYRGEELFPSGERGQILVFRQQHHRVWVACLGTRSYLHRLLDAVVAQNRTLALSFLPYAHPVVVQVTHCRAEILTLHFDEFQRPNGLFVRRELLRSAIGHDEERNKKKTCEHTSLHGYTPRLFRRAP